MKTMILFGAGASYGSKAAFPHPPPLGAALFEELEKNYPRWDALPKDAKAEFQRENKFEPGFIHMRSNCNLDVQVPGLLRDMSRYFLRFEIRPGNLYLKVAEAVGRSPRDTLISTMNYDLMIEQALEQTLGKFCYGRWPDLMKESNASLLKLHGSPNFIPQLGNNTFRNISFSMNKANVQAPCQAMPPRICINALDKADRDNNDAMVPALALYAPGKEVLYCPDYVRKFQQRYAKVCAESKRIFIVGARLSEDQHIWEPIANSSAFITFVNPSKADANTFVEWAKGNNLAHEWVCGGIEALVDLL